MFITSGPDFKSSWKQNLAHDFMVLHCTELSLSLFHHLDVERAVKYQTAIVLSLLFFRCKSNYETEMILYIICMNCAEPRLACASEV